MVGCGNETSSRLAADFKAWSSPVCKTGRAADNTCKMRSPAGETGALPISSLQLSGVRARLRSGASAHGAALGGSASRTRTWTVPERGPHKAGTAAPQTSACVRRAISRDTVSGRRGELRRTRGSSVPSHPPSCRPRSRAAEHRLLRARSVSSALASNSARCRASDASTNSTIP